jgi:hypothetical protein
MALQKDNWLTFLAQNPDLATDWAKQQDGVLSAWQNANSGPWLLDLTFTLVTDMATRNSILLALADVIAAEDWTVKDEGLKTYFLKLLTALRLHLASNVDGGLSLARARKAHAQLDFKKTDASEMFALNALFHLAAAALETTTRVSPQVQSVLGALVMLLIRTGRWTGVCDGPAQLQKSADVLRGALAAYAATLPALADKRTF